MVLISLKLLSDMRYGLPNLMLISICYLWLHMITRRVLSVWQTLWRLPLQEHQPTQLLLTRWKPTEIVQTKTYLGQWKELIEKNGLNVTIEVTLGTVVDTILEEATRDGFDVIIMGTHGRKGLSKLILGSVAEGVLHRAPCPVLLIPESATNV
jgi:nucleotide-binding universal stress UspA family protein